MSSTVKDSEAFFRYTYSYYIMVENCGTAKINEMLRIKQIATICKIFITHISGPTDLCSGQLENIVDK